MRIKSIWSLQLLQLQGEILHWLEETDGAFRTSLLHTKYFYKTYSGIQCKGTCTDIVLQGKWQHHRKTLKLRSLAYAWQLQLLGWGMPAWCAQQRSRPCGDGDWRSQSLELLMEGYGVRCYPPKVGKGQEGKKKYVMHLFLKQSALCVIFSPVLNSVCLFWADFTAHFTVTNGEYGSRSKTRKGIQNWIYHHCSELQALEGAQALDYLFSEEYLSS